MRFAVCLVAVLAACGGDDPSVPDVTDFGCTPETLVVGQTTATSCDYQYTDAEGDVATMHLAFTDPDGNLSEVDSEFNDPDMQTEGPGYLTVNLTAYGLGTATLEVYLLDDAGHASNTVSADFNCVSP